MQKGKKVSGQLQASQKKTKPETNRYTQCKKQINNKPKAIKYTNKKPVQCDNEYTIEKLLSIVDSNLPNIETTTKGTIPSQMPLIDKLLLHGGEWELEQKKIQEEEDALAAKAKELGNYY